MKTNYSAAILLVIALAAGSAAAETKQLRYTMTVFEDKAYGSAIVDGKFEKAIEKLSARNDRISDDIAAQNNLCVALTKTGQLDSAEVACAAAVEEAERQLEAHNDRLSLTDFGKAALRKELAISLSNRAIVLVALGDEAGAAVDLQRAASLEAGLDAPEINLARLGR